MQGVSTRCSIRSGSHTVSDMTSRKYVSDVASPPGPLPVPVLRLEASQPGCGGGMIFAREAEAQTCSGQELKTVATCFFSALFLPFAPSASGTPLDENLTHTCRRTT